MALTKFILGIVSFHLIGVTWAATKVDAGLRARETMKRRRSIDGLLQKRDEALLDTKELFQLTEGEVLENVREIDDAVGTKVERLEEKYKGIRVYDAVITVRKTKDGQLTGDASGTLIQNIDEDLPDSELEPKLSDEETLTIALTAEGDNITNVDDVQYYEFVYIDDNNRARLVNIVSYLIDGVKRPFYIICKQTGEILNRWEGLNTYPCCERKYKAWGGNEKMGKITYGDMPHCLSPKISNGTCYLENEYVRVVDMLSTRQENITETATFECAKGYGDEINGAFSPAIDAFFYGTVVGKMFEEWFNTTPLNSKIVIRVHYGYLYGNAFWNGENTTFGDGDYSIYPFTSLDVVGHEIGHGVTEQGSNLEYRGESGGVNEAFSDIMGEAAEDYLLNSDFLTGNTIMKFQPYMREFERPENDNMSISKVEDMEDYTDPHFSSGVFRRVWWVVVKDGGLPIRDAAAVFLYANRMYWHSTASFYDCSCGTLKAALDLGYDTAPFRMAFKDVGLDDCNVNTHVFGLNNNDTQKGVLVSETVNPVFKMNTPEWADKLVVDVIMSSEKREVVDDLHTGILITVMTNGWEFLGDECERAEFVTEGVNHVEVPDATDKEFYFKLSLSNNTTVSPENYNSTRVSIEIGQLLADFTAGYTCKQNYTSDSWESRYLYSRECGGEFESY